MRIVCLDIGTKRIGVAATDPLCISVQGIRVIDRRGGRRDLVEIEGVCRELGVERLVIGLPLDEEGGSGPAAKGVEAFAKRLGEHLLSEGLRIEIEMWDERYSTSEAEARLISFDVGRKKRRRVIDKMAAVVVLEDYIESKKIGGGL